MELQQCSDGYCAKSFLICTATCEKEGSYYIDILYEVSRQPYIFLGRNTKYMVIENQFQFKL